MSTRDVEETQQIVAGSILSSISEENEIEFETNQNFLFHDQIQATVEEDCDTFNGIRYFQNLEVPSFSELKKIIEYQDYVFAVGSKTSSLSDFLLYSNDHLGNISSRSDGNEAVENEGDFTTDREYFNNTYYNNIFYDELNNDTDGEEQQQTIQHIRELVSDNILSHVSVSEKQRIKNQLDSDVCCTPPARETQNNNKSDKNIDTAESQYFPNLNKTEKLINNNEYGNDFFAMSFSFRKNTGETGGNRSVVETDNDEFVSDTDSNKEQTQRTELQLNFNDDYLWHFRHLHVGIVHFSEIIAAIKYLMQKQNMDKYNIMLFDDLWGNIDIDDTTDDSVIADQIRLRFQFGSDTRILFFSKVMKILCTEFPKDTILYNDIANWDNVYDLFGTHVVNNCPEREVDCNVDTIGNNNHLSSLNSDVNRNNYTKKRGRRRSKYKWVVKNSLQKSRCKTFDNIVKHDIYINDNNNGANTDSIDDNVSLLNSNIESVDMNTILMSNNASRVVTAPAPPCDPELLNKGG